MGIRFLCPNGHKLNVKEFLAGKRGSCPHCNAKFLVPPTSMDGPVAEAKDDPVPSVSPVHNAMITPLDPSASVSKPASAMPFNAHPLPAGVLPSGGRSLSDPLAESGAANWYVRLASGDQFGPAQADHMREWMKEDRIPGDSLVWREGWEEWKRADEVFPKFAPAPVPAPMPAAAYAAPGFSGAQPAPGFSGAQPAPGYHPAMGHQAAAYGAPAQAYGAAPGYVAPGPGGAAAPGMMGPGVTAPGMMGPGMMGPGIAGPGAFVARPVGPLNPAAMPMPARPMMGQAVAARPVGAPTGAPAGAFDVDPVESPENSGETGEFLRTMSGDEPPKEKSESAPPPRSKNSSAAVVVTIVMIFVIAGLSFALMDILKRPPAVGITTQGLPGTGGYSIKVPGKSKSLDTQTESTAGGNMNSKAYESDLPDHGGLSFIYYLSEIPNAKAAQEQSERFFMDSAQGLLKRIGGGTITPGAAVNRAGATGKEFTIAGGPRTARVQIFLIGKHRLVMAASVPTGGSLSSDLVTNFFRSLAVGHE